ncbi:uncharacterized protein LOC135437555 [Drosophila montana]|uniref:uncharacterized protein LOC135437555 n=1 Tax=Drosophila montana TaxID=40370 RepID=UPI00313B96AB
MSDSQRLTGPLAILNDNDIDIATIHQKTFGYESHNMDTPPIQSNEISSSTDTNENDLWSLSYSNSDLLIRRVIQENIISSSTNPSPLYDGDVVEVSDTETVFEDDDDDDDDDEDEVPETDIEDEVPETDIEDEEEEEEDDIFNIRHNYLNQEAQPIILTASEEQLFVFENVFG